MKTSVTTPVTSMKNSLLYRCSLPAALVVLLLLLPGCKKDQAAPDPNAIRSTAVRITATIKAPGTESTDVYAMVGNFSRPNYYNIAGKLYEMKKQPDGTYRIDITKEDIVDTPERLHYLISRNSQFIERNADCSVKVERLISMPGSLGKEVKITVDAFRGTGSCPP
jgi:hypothetical protein